ncbi:MAG: DEAD/DEAH box helicase, partial [Candidatus Omnitrophica bacterium]|nr:DEAD/DEAH box helicase [Candidatus Omnitrophota bacterium]
MVKLAKFRALGLSDITLKALEKKGFEEPSKIQERIIPLFLNTDKDIVGQAQTGTGKTAAFGLPLIELLKENSKYVQVLILTPTRELAIQVAEEINSLKGSKRLQIVPIYGGQSIEQQLRRLKSGVDIVVGTPGRVIDHIKRKTLVLKDISNMILDEADEMLNMGFIDDVEEILKSTNSNKRVLLFSATMPDRILRLAEKYMKKYELVKATEEKLTINLTDQIYFEVNMVDKLEALCRIIDIENVFYGLIFCRTKVDVDTLANKLMERGYSAEALHGDISQYQRERILDKFKRRKANILVATDVAARGIDIVELTHVINYSLPQDPESYVHRIGRTGRAGKEGTAITFITPSEYRKLTYIQKLAKSKIRKEKIPEIMDIINSKKLRLKKDILKVIKEGDCSNYSELASEMLVENKPEEVCSALLKHFFQEELEIKNYNKIRETSKNSFIDIKGKTRLFVALGKMDGMSPRRLVDFIKNKVHVDDRKINDVQIFDKFSFINVPFEEAE